MPTVYLDMAATTPVSSRVADVVLRFMTEDFGNAGSRTHDWGMVAKRAVGDARTIVAGAVSGTSDEVVFTSGATESNNIALLGLASHGRASGRRHILSSATEHKAVLEPLEHLAGQGFDVELMTPGPSGRFESDEVIARVRPDTLLVSLMHVNNETGVMQPVRALAEHLRHTETFFHVDASQSFAKVRMDELRAPIDLISFSGHKIGAPKGVGGLVVRRRGWARVPLEPLMFGGGQERNLRPGTLPVALVMGLAEAVRERLELHDVWMSETSAFRTDLLDLVKRCDGEINGSLEYTAPHILNFSFPGIDSEALVVALRGVAGVATGSACTSASYTPSHVLSAMGLPEDVVSGALRLSWWGRPTEDLTELESCIRSLAPSA
jgi:cysteine desulfurase